MDDKDRIQEILERLVRIETKMDNYNEFKNKTDEAYNMSSQNTKDIIDIKTNLKKLFWTGAGLAIAIISFFIKTTVFHK